MPDMPLQTDPLCSLPPEELARRREGMRRVIGLIGGKWKLEILWLLNQRVHRFNELRRAIPGVTQHMLTAQLRELEAGRLVRRTIYPEMPPRVEYAITREALSLRPVFEAIFAWSASTPPNEEIPKRRDGSAGV